MGETHTDTDTDTGARLPLLAGTSKAIAAACSPRHGLRDKAFVGLLELIKKT